MNSGLSAIDSLAEAAAHRGALPRRGVSPVAGAIGRMLGAAARSIRELGDDLSVRLRDRRFWAVQFLVVAVTAGHSTLEASEEFVGHGLGAVYFVPASLYFVPVVYASLNFGRRGAIPTAIWSAALAVPNIIVWHHGAERMGELVQMAILVALAVVIASRVDREGAARRLAESRERSRQISELKYRQLFAGVVEPILVFDSSGVIHESNAAAVTLLRPRAGTLKNLTLARVLGQREARKLMQVAAGAADAGEIALKQPHGGELWMEPVCTPLITEDHGLLTQVLLRDVTERKNFQSYAQEITRAQEEERARVSHELHDVALQSLVLLVRRLDKATEQAPEALPEGTVHSLEAARGLAEGVADDLRRFARDLRPAVLDGLGLVHAIRRVVTEMSERSGVEARLETSGDLLQIDPALQLPLFRICQEALRNAERHSKATRVTVRLKHDEDGVRLQVADNGGGFDLPSFTALATRGRFGLLGIRERARLLGGECNIWARPGKGTRIEILLPLQMNGRRTKHPVQEKEMEDVS